MKTKKTVLALALAAFVCGCTETTPPSRSLGESLDVCTGGKLCIPDASDLRQRIQRVRHNFTKQGGWDDQERRRSYEDGPNHKMIPTEDSLLAFGAGLDEDQKEGSRKLVFALRRGAAFVERLYPDLEEITVQRGFDANDLGHRGGDCADISVLLEGTGNEPHADISITRNFWFVYGMHVESPVGQDRNDNHMTSYVDDMQAYGSRLEKAGVIDTSDLTQMGQWIEERYRNHDNHLHLCFEDA